MGVEFFCACRSFLCEQPHKKATRSSHFLTPNFGITWEKKLHNSNNNLALANEEPDSPEKILREIWTEKDVSKERQDDLLGRIAAKAAPGGQVGPFFVKE